MGPCEYVPPVEVEVVKRYGAIPLNETEGVYVRHIKTGAVEMIVGRTYLLGPDEASAPPPPPDPTHPGGAVQSGRAAATGKPGGGDTPPPSPAGPPPVPFLSHAAAIGCAKPASSSP